MMPQRIAAATLSPRRRASSVRADAAQDAGEQRREVRRQHDVAGQPDHRRREQRDADDVLAVGQRQRLRIVDIGVENRPRFVEERVRIPGQQIPADFAVGSGRKPQARGMDRQRIRQQHGQRRESAGWPARFGGSAN